MTPEQIKAVQEEAERRFPFDDKFDKWDRDRFMDGAQFRDGMDMWVNVAIREPEHQQRIFVTDGEALHSGIFDDYSGKIHLDKGLCYESGGSICTLEEYYTHWCPAFTLPNAPMR